MSVLLSSDKLYPDSVTKLNTKFDEVDASLATKLDKSGGTMTGDIAMGTHKITGLPSPSGAGEPSVYGHTHDERYYTESEIDAAQAVQDAALTTHKSSSDHDSRYYTESEINTLLAMRRKSATFTGLLKETKSGLTITDIDGIEFVAPRAGCIVSVCVKRLTDSATEVKTQTFRASGTTAQGRFSQGSRIGFYRSTSTGTNYPTISGNAVNSAGLNGVTIIAEINSYAVTIEIEYDSGDSIGGTD